MSTTNAGLAGALVLVLGGSSVAEAGGLFMPARGSRAGARGGAFVAGADDADSLWYNPAGLATLVGGKKHQLRADLSIVGHDVSYGRVDSGGNVADPVDNETQTIPLPTVAATFDLNDRFVLGAGLFTPWAALDGYPEDGAQRYSLISLHHTLIAYLHVGLGWKVSDKLRVGASVSNLFMAFNSRVVFSSCPGETLCAPEDPDFDAVGEVAQTDYFNPSGQIGLQYQPVKRLTIGAAYQLPYVVHASGQVRTRLPASGFFNGARIVGDSADMDITFPGALRFGFEVQAAKRWKLELGVNWEMWSAQEEIVLTPRDVIIEDQAGVGIYELGQFVIPRKLDDTLALNLGVEGQPLGTLPLTLRAGYVYETGAAPDAYLSVMTPDSKKHVLSVGAGFRLGDVRVDAVFAQAIVDDRTVSQMDTCVPLLNPIRTTGDDSPVDRACIKDGAPEHVYVGAGTYRSGWTSFSLGVNMDF
jgi:long-chain fatty acid transport protein